MVAEPKAFFAMELTISALIVLNLDRKFEQFLEAVLFVLYLGR